jgi:hypothetical protein
MRTASAIVAAAFAAAAHATTLTWIPGSTTKVEQMIDNCDYTALARTGQCAPTPSQTATLARVLGTDIGASIESDGRVIFLFGDTISPSPSENYLASDTMASSVSTDPSNGLFLDFSRTTTARRTSCASLE